MTTWVTRLIFANVAMFLVTSVFPVVQWALILVPGLVVIRPWTIVTYMFLHAGLGHLFFNMLSLYFFGPRLEARLGGRRFVALYLVSGVGGALLSFLTPGAAILGASGATFGVSLGYALHWPHDRVMVLPIPVPIEARIMVVLMAVVSLYGARTGAGGIAHLAHLGGFVGGYLYLKWSERHTPAAKFRAQAQPGARPATPSDVERWSRIRPEGLHPVNREEYERVIQKLRQEGVAHLTAAERAFLDRFSAA